MNELLEVTGTISNVLSPEFDTSGNIIQKVILDNVTPVRNNTSVRSRVLLLAVNKTLIEFTINSPITVRGIVVAGTTDVLDTIHTAHAPNGFIRYKSKIYR